MWAGTRRVCFHWYFWLEGYKGWDLPESDLTNHTYGVQLILTLTSLEIRRKHHSLHRVEGRESRSINHSIPLPRLTNRPSPSGLNHYGRTFNFPRYSSSVFYTTGGSAVFYSHPKQEIVSFWPWITIWGYPDEAIYLFRRALVTFPGSLHPR